MTNPNNPQDPNTIDENVETFDAAVRDTDNDGTIDTVVLDSDGDGYANTVLVDVDGDGEFDEMFIDSENADGVLETKISADDDYVEGLGKVEDCTEKAEGAGEESEDPFDFQGTTTEIGTDEETYDASATEDAMNEDSFGDDMGDSDGPSLHLEAGF